LIVSGRAVEIPERISLWKAIHSAPRRVRWLGLDEFRRFQNQVVDAVVEANAPYSRRVALGLAPTEWDDISSNVLKAISVFLSRVQALARETGVSPDSIELWQQVWKQRPIPRFKTLEEFHSSRIGRHLRLGGPPDLEHPIFDPREDDERQQPAARPSVNEEQIDELRRAGVLDSYDAWFLRLLVEGKPLSKAAKSIRTLRRFGRFEIPASYVADLSARLRDEHR
jgi:hypothetical protein